MDDDEMNGGERVYGLNCYVMDFEGKRAWSIKNVRAGHASRTGSLMSIGLVLGKHVTEDEIEEWVDEGYAKVADFAKANGGGRW